MSSDVIAAPGVGAWGERAYMSVPVIYESEPCGLRMRQVFEQVSLSLGFRVEFALSFWRYELFEDQEWFRAAALEARAAEVMCLSGGHEVPVMVQLWLLRWLADRKGEPAALTLSFEETAWSAPATVKALELLQSSSRLAGVDVFLHRWTPPGRGVRRGYAGRDLVFPPRHESGDSSHLHWGINE